MKKCLALLLAVIVLAGCQPRPGSASGAAGSKSSSQSSSETDAEEDGEEDAGESEQEDSSKKARDGEEEDEDAVRLPDVDAEAVAAELIEKDNILPLLFNYNGNFDSTKDLNASQMYFAVYKWYEQQPNFSAPSSPDYEGYYQLDKKKMEALVKRWFGGEDLPELQAQEEALGEAVSGVLVNYDKDRKTYYILEANLPMEEKASLKKASVSADGTLTVKIDALNVSDDEYIRTYIVKLAPAKDGSYYITSLNKGQQS